MSKPRFTLPNFSSGSVYLRLPSLILTIAIVTTVISIAGWRYIERSLLRTVGEGLALAATDIAQQFDRMLFERAGDVRLLSKALSDRLQDPSYIQTYLTWVVDTYPVYHWIGIADRNGRIIASTAPALLAADVSRTKWFLEAQSRGLDQRDAIYPAGVETFTTEKGGPDTVAFAAPLYDRTGAFQGVVSSRVAIPELEKLVAQTIDTLAVSDSSLANIEYQIVDHRGIATIDSDLAHKGLTDLATLGVPSVQLSRGGQPGFIEEEHPRHHKRVITGYSQTRGWGQPDALLWTVLMRMPTVSVLAPLESFLWKLGGVGLVILLPIFGLLVWMQQRLRTEWHDAQTERVRATSAQAHYHLLLQTTDQGIFGADRDGRCTFINRAAASMLGYAPYELLGQALQNLIHHSHADGRPYPPEDCPMLQVLSTGQPSLLTEHVLWRRDGSSFDAECSMFPINQASDNTKLVVTVTDITERKQRTQSLLQYQHQLQSLASQLRKTEEQVRQRVATELHDNLAQVLALCNMKLASLHRTAPPSLPAATERVIELVNEALRYTRQLMADLWPSMLGHDDDLTAGVQWVTAKLQRHGIKVTVVDDGRPKPMDADVLRIAYQSLHELLFNVLKHAQTSFATVSLRRFGVYLIMEVRDSGVGFNARSPKVPSQRGGFGLFNAREQIAFAGGRMRVSTAAGKGATVRIILPLKPIESAVRTSHDLSAGSSEDSPLLPVEFATIHTRIMLADDHQIMREGLRSMIDAEKDFQVVAVAADGEMAVQLARTFRPDIIIMDINMPKLNGVEATRRITHIVPDVCIIGLSVQEDPKVAHLMHKAGASATLSKGIAFNILCDTIRALFHTRDRTAPPESDRSASV